MQDKIKWERISHLISICCYSSLLFIIILQLSKLKIRRRRRNGKRRKKASQAKIHFSSSSPSPSNKKNYDFFSFTNYRSSSHQSFLILFQNPSILLSFHDAIFSYFWNRSTIILDKKIWKRKRNMKKWASIDGSKGLGLCILINTHTHTKLNSSSIRSLSFFSLSLSSNHLFFHLLLHHRLHFILLPSIKEMKL